MVGKPAFHFDGTLDSQNSKADQSEQPNDFQFPHIANSLPDRFEKKLERILLKMSQTVNC